MPLLPGQLLNNRYRVAKLIGQGGFGAVYRAWDTTLNQPCAVKENLDTSQEAQRQFYREATLLAGLRHPNLPRVSDHFPVSGQGQYLVMDFIEGQSLADVAAQRGGRLTEGEVLPGLDQVCAALDYLHSQQPPVIHRDIEPQNIIITPAGQAMLVDFGISKAYDPQLSTTAGARGVTPGFSPPEQYGSGGTDARSDIFGLGATLYVLFTGQTPPDAIDRLVRGAKLPSLANLRPDLSAEMQQLVTGALELSPAARPQTAAELRQIVGGPAAPTVTAPQPQAASGSQPHSWFPIAVLAGLVATVMLVGVVTVALIVFKAASGGSANPATPTTIARLTVDPVRTSVATTAPPPTVVPISPTREAPSTPVDIPSVTLPIPPLGAEAQALTDSEIPAADARELALQFQSQAVGIPVTVNATAPVYKVGDKQQFWISNSDTQEHKQVTAELRVLTDHVAMWVETGVRFNQNDLEASSKRFEEKTYPTNREFFGSEWTPGIDNDVHLHILHARGLGETVAGYYSSADEYSRLVNEYSNEREMFYISADSGNAKPNSDFYDGTLAHEFQHMIHWANDRNETSWVNEGMSELASYLNGFDPGGADYAYMLQPDTQLTTWADPSETSVTEHYGASYLFTAYFLDRFGEELTQAVVASSKNGVAGYNEALAAAGRTERFDDIFADWVVANYLDKPKAAPNGRFGYSNIDLYDMAVSETHRSYPASATAQVSQYGADYIRLKGRGAITIDFAGQAETPLTNAAPQGAYSWWSNRGDQSNSTLTRAFDLRSLTSATLAFSTWYDIEEGWDYAYVTVSTDGGNRWQILRGRYTTDVDPVGNAFGPGWTGISGKGETPEWVDEQVYLTPFAGKEVLIRFQMVTDDAVNHAGLLIDNLAIPELNYTDDGEAGPGDWEASGWILTDNTVTQRWLAQLIAISGDNVTVQQMPVGTDGRGQLTLADLGDLDEAILVISALAPVTTSASGYQYRITQP